MPFHISLKKFLGFGKFRYMTGAQVLQHSDGLAYLRWAHHSGMVIESEILFRIGLHPEQTHPKRIPITPELIAEAQAHEDQLNGVTHEEINPQNEKCPSVCPYCLHSRSVHDLGELESEREGVADIYALYC